MKADASSTQPRYPGLFVNQYFQKGKKNKRTLAITGGGQGIKFEVANLVNREQPQEIYPVSPKLTKSDIFIQVTILDGCPTQFVDILRLPNYDRGRQTVLNLAICLKLCGPLPERMAIGSMVYHVRPHTLPVIHCTHCLLFGQGIISCNGHAHCSKCSTFHDNDGCVREDHSLFCSPSYHNTSRQCQAHLQAVQLQELQHDKYYSL
ncbi:hypothetical protein E2C01_083037 [Portunus trituberculatus]|uniref:Uncharacterized protein n=1 Tax=Portunus trituberculatus TaxID=210409 RepID=A0A5B7J0V3_PORTR|nr:hypothetical protein [Portunus trituberculatus]